MYDLFNVKRVPPTGTMIYLLPYLISLTISSALVFFLLSRRISPGASTSSFIFFAIALMNLGAILQELSTTLPSKIFWNTFQVLFLILLPCSLAIFTIEFTGWRLSHAWRTFGGILLFPLIAFLLVLTNNFQGGLRPDVRLVAGGLGQQITYALGLQDYFIAGYSFLYLVLCLVALWGYSLKQPGVLRRQSRTLMLACAIPLLGGVLSAAGLRLDSQRDIFPLTFALSGGVMAWALFRYALFGVTPLARDVIFEKSGDAAVVLDYRGCLIDANAAARQHLGLDLRTMVGRPSTAIFTAWPDLSGGPGVPEFRSEVYTLGGANTPQGGSLALPGWPVAYEVNSVPLYDSRTRYAGRLLLFHDITERVHSQDALRDSASLLEQQVQQRTTELASANRELEALYRLAIDLADLPPQGSLDQFLAERLQQFTGAVMTALLEYEPERKALVIRHMALSGDLLARVNQVLGQNVLNITIPLSPQRYRELLAHPIVVYSELWQATLDAFPPLLANIVQELLGLEHFVGLTIDDEGELIGTAGLIMQKGQPLPSDNRLLTFAHLTAIAFRRRKAEALNLQSKAVLSASEEKYRTIIEQFAEGFILIDEQGAVSEANRAYQNIIGLPREEIIGKPVWEVMLRVNDPEQRTPQRASYLKSVFQSALQNGTSPFFEKLTEATILRPDYRPKEESTGAGAVRRADGGAAPHRPGPALGPIPARDCRGGAGGHRPACAGPPGGGFPAGLPDQAAAHPGGLPRRGAGRPHLFGCRPPSGRTTWLR